MTTAVSVQQTNVVSIMQAIYDIGYTYSNSGFVAGNLYEVPTANQISVDKQPWLTVRIWEPAGLYVGGQEHPNDPNFSRPLGGWIEPSWDFDVYGIVSYSESEPNHDVATQIGLNLWWAYMMNPDMNASCYSSGVALPEITYLEIGGKFWRAAHLKVRALEELPVQYNP